MLGTTDINNLKLEIAKRKDAVVNESDRQRYMSWFDGVLYALAMAIPNSKALDEVRSVGDFSRIIDTDYRATKGLERLINSQ